MYLYEHLGELPAANGNGTSSRLSVIEVTSIVGVTVSAAILVLNLWNTVRNLERRNANDELRVADRARG